MARPDQEAIDTFMSITGVSEAVAIQKLEENHGNLNAAVNTHFTEGDRNIAPQAAFAASHNDDMDVDDPIPFFPRDLDPFSRLVPHLPPFVSRPREVREVPIEFKDGIGVSGQSGNTPIIEDITENARNHGPETRGSIVLDDDEDDDDFVHPGPRTTTIADHVPDYSNEIEEEMIRAAIEASKHDSEMPNQDDHIGTGELNPQPARSHVGDPELDRAVSFSLQTAEKEKALRELEEGKVADSGLGVQQPASPQEMGKSTSSNGRRSQLEIGSSSIQDEDDDVEELELARHRRRRVTSSSIHTPNDIGGVDVNPPSSPQQNENVHPGSDFPSDEWGGISSVEHDEAVMLEAAMFGGIPEGANYHFPYTPRELLQNGLDRTVGTYPMGMPRPPSPSLTAQRLIREQQDDEYLASLQADREKELKAKEEVEAALAEERRKEDEIRKQMLEEQEIERQLAAKEASLPQEPTPDNENGVTLLVRMPDGSRRGRRFHKSDMLQHLFDFIDVGRGVKPGSYRLVRPYPRRAFGDGESTSTLNELGLTSKQEALYLELI